ncbi:MAG TPA: serine hydrolase [Candidatus Tyrphobacter sp.]|nr:serine hydrolase [Candidatus Tyrphobacter sp.]
MRSRYHFLIFSAAVLVIISGVYLISSHTGLIGGFKEPGSATSAEIKPAPPAPPKIQVKIDDAAAYGAFDLKGEEILGKNTEKVWPLASLTKLMTAYVALKYIPSTDLIEFDKSSLEVGGNAGHLEVGEEYPLPEMLKVMLMMSNNGAAQSIAVHYGYDKFVAAMNTEAQALGLGNTHYADPTGLSADDTSTVADMSRLVDFLWQTKPEIFELTRPQTGVVTAANTGTTHNLWNIDQFSGRPDFLGGKTGTTPEAKDNLIAIFGNSAKTNPIVAIVFGADHRYEDAQVIIKSAQQ